MGKTVESTLMNRIRWVIEATEEGTVQLVYIHIEWSPKYYDHPF
jgi:hypothetical protein